MHGCCRTLALVVLILPFAGCGKKGAPDTRTIILEAGDVKSFTYNSPGGAENFTITIESKSSPVDVYVVNEADLKAAEQNLLTDKRPEKIVASKEQARGPVALDVTVPAKSEFAVLLAGARGKTEVLVGVRGR